MAYLTETAVINKVGGEDAYLKLTDAQSLSSVDSELKKLYLDQVDTLFDGYARAGGYDTPLASALDIASVQQPLLAVANWILKTRGGREASDDDRLEYTNAMQYMRDIAAGKVGLPSGTAGSDETVGDAALDSQVVMFDRCRLRVL